MWVAPSALRRRRPAAAHDSAAATASGIQATSELWYVLGLGKQMPTVALIRDAYTLDASEHVLWVRKLPIPFLEWLTALPAVLGTTLLSAGCGITLVGIALHVARGGTSHSQNISLLVVGLAVICGLAFMSWFSWRLVRVLVRGATHLQLEDDHVVFSKFLWGWRYYRRRIVLPAECVADVYSSSGGWCLRCSLLKKDRRYEVVMPTQCGSERNARRAASRMLDAVRDSLPRVGTELVIHEKNRVSKSRGCIGSP
jgi:hypothetical protein